MGEQKRDPRQERVAEHRLNAVQRVLGVRSAR
jgi:hypothetical protein